MYDEHYLANYLDIWVPTHLEARSALLDRPYIVYLSIYPEIWKQMQLINMFTIGPMEYSLLFTQMYRGLMSAGDVMINVICNFTFVTVKI